MDLETIKNTISYLEKNNLLVNSLQSSNEEISLKIQQYYTQNTSVKKKRIENIEIQNRRYLGCKHKLIGFIKNIVKKECEEYNSFLDLFGGTGIVGASFNKKETKIIINDLLYSNYMAYNTWLDNAEYDILKIEKIILEFNSSNPIEENYVSKNFGDSFFSMKNAIKIGYIREKIEEYYNSNKINKREKYILITSLLYALDKVANTCGHYDAYRKKMDANQILTMAVPKINNEKNHNNKIYRMDSNELVKLESADIVYIDPPYNSRQYADAYHLLENIAKWEKPEVVGVAKKMVDRADIKSKYCTVAAPVAFKELIKNINSKYILVSYNNMGEKGAGRSQAKISDTEIEEILKTKGEVKIFEQDHQYFTTGKSEIDGHKERIFLCKVFEEKKKEEVTELKKSEKIKSPLNYTGGKYKLLPQIEKFFPKNINTFYDIFTGGVNVGINAQAKKIVCIDKEKVLIELYNLLKKNNYFVIEEKIDNLIKSYGLSNTIEYGYNYYSSNSSSGLGNFNKSKYSLLRDYLNRKKERIDSEYIIAFYTLIIYSFNNQIRFNKNNELNIPVGKRDFNKSLRKNLKSFMEKLNKTDIDFINMDFRKIDINSISSNDFLYLDPPYLIANAAYNESGKWTEKDEKDLLKFLDKVNKKGIKFALSNVIEHSGNENYLLKDWVKKNNFNLNMLDFNYNNSNYQKKDKDSKSIEVLITNY